MQNMALKKAMKNNNMEHELIITGILENQSCLNKVNIWK